MKKRLKVAFIGGGINSAVGNAHRSAIQLDQRFELVAGCFSNILEINERSALTYGIDRSRCYSSLEELIQHEATQLDAAIILTPTPVHVAHASLCMNAGLSVICEKALASNCSEIQHLVDLQGKLGSYLTVTYNYTGYPMIRELQQQIRSGTLGTIHQVLVEMPQDSFAKLDHEEKPLTPQEWRQSDLEIPTISLDLGVHVLQLVNFLTNEEPQGLSALTQRETGTIPNVIDNVNCILDYISFSANVWYGKTALGHQNGLRVRIYGNKGSAEWNQIDPEHLYCASQRKGRFVIDRSSIQATVASEKRYNRFKAGHPSGFIEAFANLYSDIADDLSIKASGADTNNIDSQYTFGAERALKDMQALTALHFASSTSQWASINGDQ